MELTWYENYLIRVLRVTVPFFRKKGLGLCSLEYGFRDGDYVVFKSDLQRMTVTVVYNPGFDILIERSKSFNRKEQISLVKEKGKYSKYAHLPEKIGSEEEIESTLIGYLELLGDYYLN